VKSLTFLSWVLWNSTGGRCTSLNFWSSAQFWRTLEVKSRTVASWVVIWSQGNEEDTFFWITGQFFTIMQETIIKWVPYSTNAVGVVCTMGQVPREQVICKYAIDKRKTQFEENKWYASMQLIKEKPCWNLNFQHSSHWLYEQAGSSALPLVASSKCCMKLAKNELTVYSNTCWGFLKMWDQMKITLLCSLSLYS
jgi:hypothetical protein